jgi:hypothetical protein
MVAMVANAETRWNDKTFRIGTLFIGGTEVTATAAELNKLDGVGAAVASGTQAANITDASVAHALNATFSDVEVETALNNLGTKINSVIAALEAFGITASS